MRKSIILCMACAIFLKPNSTIEEAVFDVSTRSMNTNVSSQSDFLIEDETTLVQYIGDDSHITIPSQIKKSKVTV